MTDSAMTISPPASGNSFDALMNAAVDAIIIIDATGLIMRFNPAAQVMFGHQEADMVGQNVSLLMAAPHRGKHDRYLARYLSTGKAEVIGVGREETAVRSNGDVFPMHLSVGEASINGETCFVGIIRDLSGQKQAMDAVRNMEQQLIHADRLVVMGELTAGIAHEINQPLTAIAAYADAGHRLISSGRQVDIAELQVICERVAQQARRAGTVIARLRGLARTGTVSKGRRDLNRIINNVLLLVEYEIKKYEINFICEPGIDLPDLNVDEIQIQQILVNLIKNAMDAIIHPGHKDGSDGGGRIMVTVKNTGDYVEVAVKDNGPGVADADLGRLFEPFFTTKPQGVGLGLSICKNIAVAHGGALNYQPEPGGGARFVLRLPCELIG